MYIYTYIHDYMIIYIYIYICTFYTLGKIQNMHLFNKLPAGRFLSHVGFPAPCEALAPIGSGFDLVDRMVTPTTCEILDLINKHFKKCAI